MEPSNTPQRQRSIIRPNGRNATLVSARCISVLIIAWSLTVGLSTRPSELRYCGVIDNTMVSPIASLDELGFFPERLGQSGHAQTDVEVLGFLDHRLGLREVGGTTHFHCFRR